jgi:hypothetical protein
METPVCRTESRVWPGNVCGSCASSDMGDGRVALVLHVAERRHPTECANLAEIGL